jgi:hypothetical protein
VDTRSTVKVLVPGSDLAFQKVAESADSYDIARRSPEELLEILKKRQALVVMLECEVVGFVYFKRLEGDWLSVSGLVVREDLRSHGFDAGCLKNYASIPCLSTQTARFFFLQQIQPL